MDRRFVYLAGPISGLSYKEAVNWRDSVQKLFLPGIVGVSPMRMKEWAKKIKIIKDVTQYEKVAEDAEFLISGESRAINTRDMMDCREVDMIFAYLPKEFNDRRPSWGTAKEIGYAAAFKKPIVLVTDDKGLAAHPLYREDCGWIVPTLELGAEVVNSVLGVYVGQGG